MGMIFCQVKDTGRRITVGNVLLRVVVSTNMPDEPKAEGDFCHLGNSSSNWSGFSDPFNSNPDSSRDIQIKFEHHEIEFKNGYHIKGDFKIYSGKFIAHNSSIPAFKEKLHDISGNNVWSVVLSFCLTSY